MIKKQDPDSMCLKGRSESGVKKTFQQQLKSVMAVTKEDIMFCARQKNYVGGQMMSQK